VARTDPAALAGTLRHALTLTAALSIPAAAGLALFGTPIIGLIYEHGRFGPADTAAAAAALGGYALGLAGYAGIKIVTPAFYALNDVATPMRVSLLSIALNLGLNWTFVHVLGFGHTGLAVSTSLVALANFALLAFVLRRRIGRYGTGLATMLGRIVVATAVMSAAAAGADGLLGSLGPAAHYARVGVILLVALPVFALACRWLAIPLPRIPGLR
jgi:putative peptidoglycan lipid II flippase